MHKIDKSFRETKKRAKKRKQRKLASRLFRGLGLLLFLALFGGAAYLFSNDMTFNWWPADQEAALDEDETLLGGLDETDEVGFQSALVDLPGDPLIVAIDGAAEAENKLQLPVPARLDKRVASDHVVLLSDTMIKSSQQFVATLPSSQEDFAYFRAHEDFEDGEGETEGDSDASASVDGQELIDAEGQESLGNDSAEDLDDGWGGGLSDEEGNILFKRTRIENTTSVSIVRDEFERRPDYQDFFVSILHEKSLSDILGGYRFSAFDAELAGGLLSDAIDPAKVEPGYVVAMRGMRMPRQPGKLSLMQMSLYKDETFVAAIARSDNGSLVKAADPWVRDDLFKHSPLAQGAQAKTQFRLLDAFYSAAMRNKVPSAIVGEAIVLMSRSHDLNAFANEKDRLVLLYTNASGEKNPLAGRILYVGIEGEQRSIKCYVYKHRGTKGYSCEQGRGKAGTGGKGGAAPKLSGGMVTPVDGVLSSPFGPRKHPILKKVKLHAGVDWRAPTGSPVYAAFNGKVAYAGDGRGYGNLIKLSHSGGRETRYAHLHRFAKGLKAGKKVNAGDLIGYVGTTGLSTGPHLHFELRLRGNPIDPLGGPVVAFASGGSAIEQLTNQIIRVESAGNARAKNPLSSATGLGQFINSTWLRMMRTYRPDLARSMSKAQLLELRFDPTVSREMVKNLARENEAYLRARGHQITAGRLYLAHFLGTDGAHKVLSANQEQALVEVVGAQVISANPFLRGKSVAYVVNWAERKMNRRSKRLKITNTGKRKAAPPPRLSKQYLDYKKLINGIINPQMDSEQG